MMNIAKTGPAGMQSLLAYCASMLLIIFVGVRFQRENLNAGLAVTEVFFVALPAILVLFANRESIKWKEFSVPTPKQLLLTGLIGLCAVVLAVYKGIVARKVLVGVDTSGDDVTVGMSFLLLILLAPLCEELLFRPVLQNGLARYWSNRTAVVLTALFFALFHLSLLRFAETFIIGFFAGIVFLKTKRFWCAVFVHFLCNALGPTIWMNAKQLSVLLNPIAGIVLTGVAVTSCYFLGEKNPEGLKGLRYINWALFGSNQGDTGAARSRTMSVVAGAIIISLLALLGYGHAIAKRTNSYSHKYVASEKDAWTLLPQRRIHASSELRLKKIPEKYEDLIITVPFEEAVIESVKFRHRNMGVSPAGGRRYRIDLSSDWTGIQDDPLVVSWSFPIDCLTRTDNGYRTPLCSLVPTDSLSVRFSIAPGSEFRYSGAEGELERLLFQMSVDRPRVVYGSCDIVIEEKNNP